MAGYVPAFERLGALLGTIAGLIVRRLRHPDIEEAPATDNDTDSSHTSISSASSNPPPPPTPPPLAKPPRKKRSTSLQLSPPPGGGGGGGVGKDGRRKVMDLTAFPPELQVLILSHLPFPDIQRLRRTARFYATFITRDLLRDIYGARLDAVLLSHCTGCHAHDATRASLLYADISSPRYPFCSTCGPCAARRDELVAGKRVSMGDFHAAFVCRWCGLPITSWHAWREPSFHRPCYAGYGNVLLANLIVGWGQFCVFVAGSALCFRYFRGEALVLGPCIVSVSFSSFSWMGDWQRSEVSGRSSIEES